MPLSERERGGLEGAYMACLRGKALLGVMRQSKASISALVETTAGSPCFPSRRPSSYRDSCLQWKVAWLETLWLLLVCREVLSQEQSMEQMYKLWPSPKKEGGGSLLSPLSVPWAS